MFLESFQIALIVDSYKHSKRVEEESKRAAPAATLAVEHYGDALWLCAVRGAGSEPLAHFSSPEAAQRFRVLLAATQASSRAAGASGI